MKRKLTAMLGSLFIALAVPAAAHACTVSTAGEYQAFASVGDHSNYVLMSGSDFSAGANGWSVSRALVSTAVNALNFNGTTVPAALQISAGGNAVSPTICVSSATPTFRFFSRASSFSGMNVNLLWDNQFGLPQVSPVGFLGGTGSWQISQQLSLGKALPLWMPGSTLSVRLQFVPTIASSWAIDEVFIDPYNRG